METNPESLQGEPLGTGLTDDEEEKGAEEFTLDEDDQEEIDPSDYDPRSYWDDPTGVDGAIHGDHAEQPVVNASVDDLGDLGDILPH